MCMTDGHGRTPWNMRPMSIPTDPPIFMVFDADGHLVADCLTQANAAYIVAASRVAGTLAAPETLSTAEAIDALWRGR